MTRKDENEGLNYIRQTLIQCRKDIKQAIYSEDGLDGKRGMETLKKIKKALDWGWVLFHQ